MAIIKWKGILILTLMMLYKAGFKSSNWYGRVLDFNNYVMKNIQMEKLLPNRSEFCGTPSEELIDLIGFFFFFLY